MRNITPTFADKAFTKKMRSYEIFDMIEDAHKRGNRVPFDYPRFRDILKQGIDVDTTRDDYNLLHCAVQHDMVRVTGHLIKAGVDINKPTDLFPRTPLMLSVKSNLHGCLDLLISSNADMNIQKENGETALHIAVKSENLYAFEKLLAKGADDTLTTTLGKTAYELIEDMQKGLVIRTQFEKIAQTRMNEIKKQTYIKRRDIALEKSLSTQKPIKHKRLILPNTRKMS